MADLTKEEKAILKAAVAIMKKHLTEGKPTNPAVVTKLNLIGFGTFKIRLRAPMEFKAPGAKKKAKTPAKLLVGFKASVPWIQELNGIVAAPAPVKAAPAKAAPVKAAAKKA